MDWSGRIVEIGVDWLTCTAKKGELGSEVLRALADSIMSKERAAGEALTDYGAEGFDGWMCGGVRFGERQDDVLFAVSGEVARENWRDALPHAGNVSRLDLQVTAKLEEPDLRVHEKGERAFIRWRNGEAETRPRGKPPKGGVIDMIPHGATLMLGTRISDLYLRNYDKGAERLDRHYPPPSSATSWVPGLWWRYEAELKRKVARATAMKLAAMDPKAETDAVRSMVYREFRRKGVTPRFHEKGREPEIERPPRAPTNDDRSIRYVRDCVGPMLRRLRDNGRGNDSLAALAETLFPERGNMIQVHDKIGQHRGVAVLGHDAAEFLAERGAANGYRLNPGTNAHIRYVKGVAVLVENGKTKGATEVTFATIAP